MGFKSQGYRSNEAVAIEPLDDKQGYNVGWVEKGEWLQYEISLDRGGRYDFVFRLARNIQGDTRG